ncbi:MAG: Stp1/IreP family PP2C-type Ser/Thr phosphatase [Actinomycetes bacterium]
MTRLVWGSASDVGRVRQANQDMYFGSDELIVVADGMGGHNGGEVASAVAVESLQREFVDRSTEGLVSAVQLANDSVVSTAAADPELVGMGTTLCAIAPVVVDGAERLAMVNVGDSRIYLLMSQRDLLKQVTEDHSLVATLERQGRLTRAEAAVHPQRNILTRALGIDARVLVDSWEVRPVVGDRYVLCSDGLFNEVDENRMAATLRKLADPTDAARELVRLANEGGGRDNITVVIVDVVNDGSDSGEVAVIDDDDRVTASRSGEEREAHDRTSNTLSASDKHGGTQRRRDRQVARAPRARIFTWRVALFVVAALLVLVVAAASVTFYSRASYFVGFDGDSVVIYRGRPGGVLWIQPKVAEATDLVRSTVPRAVTRDIEQGKIEPSLSSAHAYVQNLHEQQVVPASGGEDPTAVSTSAVPAIGN